MLEGKWGFAFRTTLAAVGAVYLSMLMELGSPQWAMLTVLVVSPPARGAALRKTAARLIGTPLGCVAALVLAGLFPQQPLGYVLGLGLWIGGCLYFATLRRGFVTYGAALAGFTAAIVGAATISQPQLVFTTAVNRGAETVVGILAALIASAVSSRTDDAPGDLADRVGTQAAQLLAWAAQQLSPAPAVPATPAALPSLPVEDAPLTKTLLDLDAAVLNATAERPALRRAGRWITGLPTVLLSLQSATLAVARGRQPNASDATDADLERLRSTMVRVRSIVGAGARLRLDELDAELRELEAEMRHLADYSPAPAGEAGEAGEIVAALIALLTGMRAILTLRVPAPAATRPFPPPSYSTDPVRAGLALGRTVVAVVVAYLIWDATAWSSGPTFFTVAAVAMVIGVLAENPVGGIVGFFRGSLLGVAVGLPITYLLLPRGEGFLWLAVVSLPLLVVGSLMEEFGATAGLALAFINAIISTLGISNPQKYNLVPAIEGVVALLAGTGLASLLYRLTAPDYQGVYRRRWMLARMRRNVEAARRQRATGLARGLARGLAGSGARGRDQRLAWETQMYDQLRRVQAVTPDPVERDTAIQMLLAGRAAFASSAA